MSEEEEDDPRFPDIDAQPLMGWKASDDGPIESLPEGLVPVRFLPGQRNPPPNILWGDCFEKGHRDEMPIEWQLQRVMKVASAMNHAASHAQDLLKQTVDIAMHQEAQLHKHVAHNLAVDEMIQQMTDTVNIEANARTEEILQLRAYVRAARAEAVRYALLAADRIDPDTQLSWGGETVGERLAKQESEGVSA